MLAAMSRRPSFLLLAVGLGATLIVAGCGGSSRPVSPTRARSTVIGPVVFTAAQLVAESRRLHQPVFWAGLSPGYSYQFERTYSGSVIVRYLPLGLTAGATGGRLLTVATYPFPGAFSSLKQQARRTGARAHEGFGGSIVFVDPKSPSNVYMAFPGVSAQIVIYARRPAVAFATAESGQISPVGG
jgi:hypothetical protein